MISPATYSVVGVRANGSPVTISTHDSYKAAEQASRLIVHGSAWRGFYISPNGQAGSPQGRPEKR
ncbi:MAG: hypothetical protein ACT4QC_01775 [Planctomycetaceae bacterium]